MKHCPYETNYNYRTERIHNIGYIKKDNTITMVWLEHETKLWK